MTRYAGYIFTAVFFLFLVDGIVPQAQMLLFSGRILIPGVSLKIALVALLALSLLIHLLRSGTLLLPQGLVIPYYLFFSYLVIHFLVSLGEYPPGYLLFSYNSYYFFLLALPFALYVQVTSDLIRKWFVLLAVPIIALGMAQFFSNSPILPTASVDQTFRVYAFEYYGKTRAFSLFNSGLNYGHFLSIAGALCVVAIVWNRKIGRLKFLALFFIVALACYTTLTRNLYIEFCFTAFSALLLCMVRHWRSMAWVSLLTRYLPVMYGVVSLLLVTILQVLAVLMRGTSTLLQQESLLQRYVAWKFYFPLWTGHGLKTLLFGVGLIQNERFPVTEQVLLDNSFLAIGLHIGLVGLVLWFYFMWKLWKHILTIWKRMPDNALLVACAAIWSTWISSGLYNINFGLYAILAVIILAIFRTERLLAVDREMCAEQAVVSSGN